MQETTQGPTEAQVQELLAGLRTVHGSYAALLTPESDATLHHRPATGEWSAIEVTCHIADLDMFNRTERFNAILMEDNPTLPAYEPADEHVTAANYQALSAMEALDLLKQERDLILALLEGLRPHEWVRTGIHPRLGERTLFQLADMRNHDQMHAEQARAAIASAK